MITIDFILIVPLTSKEDFNSLFIIIYRPAWRNSRTPRTKGPLSILRYETVGSIPIG